MRAPRTRKVPMPCDEIEAGRVAALVSIPPRHHRITQRPTSIMADSTSRTKSKLQKLNVWMKRQRWSAIHQLEVMGDLESGSRKI